MADTSFKLGRFVVRLGIRPDNPAFPVYLIFRRERLIGKQFSMPSLTDCEWIERNNGKYADRSEHASQPYGWTAANMRRQDRLRKQEEEDPEPGEALEAA